MARFSFMHSEGVWCSGSIMRRYDIPRGPIEFFLVAGFSAFKWRFGNWVFWIFSLGEMDVPLDRR